MKAATGVAVLIGAGIAVAVFWPHHYGTPAAAPTCQPYGNVSTYTQTDNGPVPVVCGLPPAVPDPNTNTLTQEAGGLPPSADQLAQEPLGAPPTTTNTPSAPSAAPAATQTPVTTVPARSGITGTQPNTEQPAGTTDHATLAAIATLNAAGRTTNTTQVANLLAMPYGTVATELASLQSRGLITDVSTNAAHHWRLTAAGKALP